MMFHLQKFSFWLLFVLAFLIGGCGGGGGGDFENQGVAPINVSINADKTTLQTNLANALPDISGPYTNTITVQVQQDGQPFAAQTIAIDVVSGLSSGALHYLDGNEAHEDENGNPLAYRSLVFNNTTGTGTAHFHSSSTPGTVLLRARSLSITRSKRFLRGVGA